MMESLTGNRCESDTAGPGVQFEKMSNETKTGKALQWVTARRAGPGPGLGE